MGLAPKSGVKCMGIQTKGLFSDARLLELSHERLQEKLKQSQPSIILSKYGTCPQVSCVMSKNQRKGLLFDAPLVGLSHERCKKDLFGEERMVDPKSWFKWKVQRPRLS